MLTQVNFQFQLRTLFVFILSASVALTWFAWLDTGWDILDWWPGWLGFFATLGFAGSLLICKRDLPLAADMFVMAWLLVCINLADSAYVTVMVYDSSDTQLPRTDEAIDHTKIVWGICLTQPVVLMPLFLLRRELLQRVFGSWVTRLLFFITVCDSVLLILMVRYLFTRTPMM